MNLTLAELNELYYCVGQAINKGEMVNVPLAKKLLNKLNDEIEYINAQMDLAENGPYNNPNQ